MNEQQGNFLRMGSVLPARLNAEQTAFFLNCQPHDIPILVEAKLLKPLGNPPRGGQKFFGTAYVMSMMQDLPWLARMTNAIHGGWRAKNARRRTKLFGAPTPLRQPTLPNIGQT